MKWHAVPYDLGKAPASWDFLNFLINAEIERQMAGADRLGVHFIPGPKDGFRDDGLGRPLDQRQAILENVMRPALKLINAVELDYDNVPAPSYLPSMTVELAKRGTIIPHFTVPEDALAEVDAYLAGRVPIVITLREASYYPQRNSKLDNWIALAKQISEPVIFVRDTAKADEPIDGFETCPRASRDFLFRAALMQRARINLMVANGPMGLMQHMRGTQWIMFKPLCTDLPEYKAGQPGWWHSMGIGVAGQWPWTNDFQRICWADDTLQVLETAWAGINGLPDPHPIKPLGPIFTRGAMSDDDRFEHVKANIAKVKQRMFEVRTHGGTAILACYGPSLLETWGAIRHERNFTPGAQLVSMSGTHDFLIERGLRPNLHIDCDPREHKHKMVTRINRKTEYLIASCVHPSYIDKLVARKANTTLWHLCNGDESMRILQELEPKTFLVGGGGSVGLRAVCVMYALGFRKFILHGMDCSFDEKSAATHAGPHGGKPQQLLTVQAGERWFKTSPVLVSYAQQFIDMVKMMMNHPIPSERPDFNLHGDGLLQEMLRVGIAAQQKRKYQAAEAQQQKVNGDGRGHPGSVGDAGASAVLPAG